MPLCWTGCQFGFSPPHLHVTNLYHLDLNRCYYVILLMIRLLICIATLGLYLIAQLLLI